MAVQILQGSHYMLFPLLGQGKQWYRKHFVLYGPAKEMNSSFFARLEWYDNRESFLADPHKYAATMYIDEIHKIELPLCSVRGRIHVMELQRTRGTSVILSMRNNSDYEEWVHTIRQLKKQQEQLTKLKTLPLTPPHSPEPPESYEVIVKETDGAKRNDLPPSALLVFRASCISLQMAPKTLPIVEWPYKAIRRYGSGANVFSFEAGGKSTTGPGLFSFRPKVDGKVLHEAVRRRTQELKTSQRTLRRSKEEEERAHEPLLDVLPDVFPASPTDR